MIRKMFLPVLAIAGVMFAAYTVVGGSHPSPAATPAAEPSRAPFANYVAGAGIVEAFSENIQVGTVVPGVVEQIFVKVGDNVRKGQPLWLIDDRDLQARRRAVKSGGISAGATPDHNDIELCTLLRPNHLRLLLTASFRTTSH